MSADTQVAVTRRIDAPAQTIFNLLTDPARHVEQDATDMIRGVARGARLQEVGQVFRMNMYAEHMGGDYLVDNHVTVLQEPTAVGWKTAVADTEPPGWEWRYDLHEDGDATDVTLTYDWSQVTDQQLLDRVGFPAISRDQMERSLADLAAAVEG